MISSRAAFEAISRLASAGLPLIFADPAGDHKPMAHQRATRFWKDGTGRAYMRILRCGEIVARVGSRHAIGRIT
jgi:hypothetical protein